ncbi:hypothetical protein I553_10521 [Mycobacterium xenopi 4042]|uniref:Uncharacterized protein n=1 Tax=Mycobacterium xenopi 4042 TaxID=1299334 RepID=X8DK01_MYCXE|nr:hypothetical protein I553_10521 [Mycobacterium xenopi 4042]
MPSATARRPLIASSWVRASTTARERRGCAATARARSTPTTTPAPQGFPSSRPVPQRRPSYGTSKTPKSPAAQEESPVQRPEALAARFL